MQRRGLLLQVRGQVRREASRARNAQLDIDDAVWSEFTGVLEQPRSSSSKSSRSRGAAASSWRSACGARSHGESAATKRRSALSPRTTSRLQRALDLLRRANGPQRAHPTLFHSIEIDIERDSADRAGASQRGSGFRFHPRRLRRHARRRRRRQSASSMRSRRDEISSGRRSSTTGSRAACHGPRVSRARVRHLAVVDENEAPSISSPRFELEPEGARPARRVGTAAAGHRARRRLRRARRSIFEILLLGRAGLALDSVHSANSIRLRAGNRPDPRVRLDRAPTLQAAKDGRIATVARAGATPGCGRCGNCKGSHDSARPRSRAGIAGRYSSATATPTAALRPEWPIPHLRQGRPSGLLPTSTAYHAKSVHATRRTWSRPKGWAAASTGRSVPDLKPLTS